MKYPFLDLATVNAPYLEQIKAAVNRVIDSGRYVGGAEVETLERNLCELTGAPHCVAVSNGLDALRMILRGYLELGRLRKGDKVMVPSNTYIASVLAITDCGLEPLFVEPSIETLNIDPQKAIAAYDERVKAIMPVHLYGRVAWDDEFVGFVKEKDLIVIEDNAQAIGAESDCDGIYGSRQAGALGDAGAFSFYPTKNIGAFGDAGAVVTHDNELASVVRALANYGSDRRYHNIYEGWNCRLDPVQAAVLNVKIPHVKEENALRREIARVYDTQINNPDVKKPMFVDNDTMVWHQYVIMSAKRDELRAYLSANGVATDIHYPEPPHRQPCYSRYAALSLPLADKISREALSLPISRCTSLQDAASIAEIINLFR